MESKQDIELTIRAATLIRSLATLIGQSNAPAFPGIDKVQRIAFKGGNYPDRETDLGGLGFTALVSVIRESLQDIADGTTVT